MLKMRLQRVGRKHEPVFRLVLTDSKNSTKSGRTHEVLGTYDPRKTAEAFKADRIKYWISQGVGLTGTVNNLLITHKIIEGKKVNVLPKKTPIVKEKAPEVVKEAPKGETQKAEPIVEPAPVEEAPAEEPTV
jgi:small subunit ribosomal protein S16